MALRIVWSHQLFLILYTIELLVILLVSGSSQELFKYGEFQHGKYMFDAFKLKTLENVGPKMCLLACMRQSGCDGVNYCFENLYCELLLFSAASVLVGRDGYKYSSLSAWEIPNDVCWPNPCKEYKTCVVTYDNLPVCVNSGIRVVHTNSTGCTDIKNRLPEAEDGVYQTSNGFFYCDMTTDGGGWTVFQRRIDGSVDFFKDWDDYKFGFGVLNGEFWLGNEKLHQLTTSGTYHMRVDLEDGDGKKVYALYKVFKINNEQYSYTLTIGAYSGDAGNTMGSYSNGRLFQTRDRAPNQCATNSHGAWWYYNCYTINLNGEYLPVGTGGQNHNNGITWYHFKGYYYSLKSAKMMIRKV